MRIRGITFSLASALLTNSTLALKELPLPLLSTMATHAIPAPARLARHHKRSFAAMSRGSSTTGLDGSALDSPVKVFCDLDGVLADFDAGVLRACGRRPAEMSAGEMWSRLARTPNFFEQLEWVPEAKELWEVIKPYNPTILTGMPRGNWAAAQKRAWCRVHLGEDVPVITCMSAQKHTHYTHGSILIDDRETIVAQWTAAGGLAIHHADVNTSIDRLQTILCGPQKFDNATSSVKKGKSAARTHGPA